MIEVGQTVGNYNITVKLGEGGMGTVFLAEHPVIGSKVALKAIHPQFARNTDVISRFMNEAKSVNQIRHDHIVDITDFGHTPDGDFYFIMEYLQGQSLGRAIERNGYLPPARALDVAAQIADALQASHEHGVVHRDLKPENIFLIVRDTNDDFVKVLDFGLAKLMSSDEPVTHNTAAGSVMGTPFYMAPEQCEGKADLDHRTDIYALGVILFEMLTGKVPFGGRGYYDIIVKQITVPPPAARSIRPELSPALDVILFRALAKDPGTRFQTMSEFRDALLDPEGYAASGLVMGADDNLSLRARVAMPMARAEIHLRSETRGEPAAIGGPRDAPSTFGESVGAIEVGVEDLRQKRHLARNVLLVGVVALVGVATVERQYRQQATRFLIAAVSPKPPATVLVTFNSDPNGATVAKADGTILGVTPLLTQVSYGTTALEYVIRKDGYLAKVASIVPNAPSPFFAVLEVREVPPPVAPLEIEPLPVPPLQVAQLPVAALQIAQLPVAPPPEPQAAGVAPTTRSAPAAHPHVHEKARASEADPAPDEEDNSVMAPSTH
jgi:Protein kinase domain